MMNFDLRFAKADWLCRLCRSGGLVLEVAVLSALIFATRCANHADVFVGGKIYFVDADCYARMTRARLVAEHPGLIVRRENFQNFPAGIVPHTTAPLDYLIVGLGKLLHPWSAQSLDLAGAVISPLLAIAGGIFLCCWTRRERFRFRWATLLLYALSPILARGNSLGRPDHQALLIVLILVALAAEWSLRERPTRGWGIVSGMSWAIALWVSLYEPLILLVALALVERRRLFARQRRSGWLIFMVIVVVASAIERRLPQLPDPALRLFFLNWSETIGELQHVGLTNPIWLQWCGLVLIASPILVFLALRQGKLPRVFAVLFVLTFFLTVWQARWAYFFAIIFCLTIPALLEVVRPRWFGWLLFALGLIPVLQSWGATLWPNEQRNAEQLAARMEAVEWRAMATLLPRGEGGSFLAPWWLSPEVTYWSGEPGVAGSAHESLPGIVASARFFASDQPNESRAILREHSVRWVFAYDSDRVAQNGTALLGRPLPPDALAFTLDRTPSRAPKFLALTAENGSCKLYRVRD